MAPPSQSHQIDETATVTANLFACGTPLPRATVDLTVGPGSNAGAAGSGPAVTDPSGNATVTYTGTAAGTETMNAVVNNAVGPIPSNSVDVDWLPRPTTITSTAALQTFAEGGTATLTDSDTQAPVPGKPVTLTPRARWCSPTALAVRSSWATTARPAR